MTPTKKTSLAELLADYPPQIDTTAAQVRERIPETEATFFVVLDDDPTGTQSVSGLPVLTAWEVSDFEWAMSTDASAVYIMTNSRSLDPDDAKAVNIEVVTAALNAADKLGKKVAFVSRSDSTLRGHFPLETDTIAAELANRGRPTDGVVVIPAFGDAGRITVGGTHYAGSIADGFIPVGESEFAKDATFGFKNSYLPEWIAEKSDGRYSVEQVIAISLTELRTNLGEVVKKLTQAKESQPIICDIVSEEDLRQLSLALIDAEAAGSTFIYRVGPPFVRARIGQDVHPPLTRNEIDQTRNGAEHQASGGLIVVGSHVGVTTRQLAHLEAEQTPARFEIDVARVIDPTRRDEHLGKLITEAAEALDVGNVVLSTSRKLVTGSDADASLDIARQVSAAVVEVVQGVLAKNKPRFVIAKGGITSSDVAAKGLAMRRAMVIGPMLPGIVSLWSAQDGPAQGVPYIIFAGNVGTDQSLAEVATKLSI